MFIEGGVEHQKLNQTAATPPAGWVFDVQLDLLEKKWPGWRWNPCKGSFGWVSGFQLDLLEKKCVTWRRKVVMHIILVFKISGFLKLESFFRRKTSFFWDKPLFQLFSNFSPWVIEYFFCFFLLQTSSNIPVLHSAIWSLLSHKKIWITWYNFYRR